MQGRTLLILLVAVLALGAVLWLDRDQPGSDEREERAALLLPTFEAEAVASVRLEATAEGAAPVTVRRVGPAPGVTVGDAWEVTEPAEWNGQQADASAVRDLLSALGSLPKERVLDDPDLDDLGLRPPQLRLRLERTGGADPLELAVGGQVPASRSLVMAVTEGEESRVYLVDRSILGELGRRDWRDPVLFPRLRSDVSAVTLDGPGGHVELVRSAGPGVDGFRLVAPWQDIADDDRVASLLDDLENLTADHFVDPGRDPGTAPAGLADPLGTLTISFGAQVEPVGDTVASETDDGVASGGPDADTLVLTLGRPQPDGLVHVRAEGAGAGTRVAATRTLLTEVLNQPAESWASRRLTEHRAFDVIGMVVEDDEGRLSFERRDDDWYLGDDPVGYLPLSDLLNALTEARAEELVRGGSAPGPVELTFNLRVQNGSERVETVRFHRGTLPAPAGAEAPYGGDDGRVAVTLEDRDGVFHLGSQVVQELRRLLAELRTELARDEALAPADGP